MKSVANGRVEAQDGEAAQGGAAAMIIPAWQDDGSKAWELPERRGGVRTQGHARSQVLWWTANGWRIETGSALETACSITEEDAREILVSLTALQAQIESIVARRRKP
jgi:hypothetical protein